MEIKPIIRFNSVTFAYDGKTVLDKVSLSVNRNESVWIVGPNGGGKTTLIKLLIGLVAPHRGTVEIFGKAPNKSRLRIGYMPQAAHLDPLFPVTALDIALMGRIRGNKIPGLYNSKDCEAALEAMRLVGLEGLEERRFAALSGGQQRRLLIARALADNPEILVLDEPTANLDLQAEKGLNDILEKLTGKMTLVLVSHDPAFVSKSVEKVFCVNRTVAEHPTSEVNAEFLGHFFGGDLRMIRHDKHVEEE